MFKVLENLLFFLLYGIVLVGFLACTRDDSEIIQIEFELFYQGEKLNCENLKTLPIELHELRFYLHELKYADQTAHLVENEFQNDKVAYLDFLATHRHCNTANKLLANQVLSIKAHKLSDANLSFRLGVPEHLNHQNPVKAARPLNRSDMHWQWLSGYKFFRLEYLHNQSLNRFHLGSIACSGKIPDAVDCKYPNRLAFQLENYNTQTSLIEVHTDQLLETVTDSLCMGNPEEQHCEKWFTALQENVFKVGVVK